MDTKIIMFPASEARQRNPRGSDEQEAVILRPRFGRRGSSDEVQRETTPERAVSVERGGRATGAKRMMDASIMATLVRPMLSTGFMTTLVS